MSKSGDVSEDGNEDFPPILAPALKVINQLEQEGIIEKPTIGGSIALVYYSQPMKTEDLDIFCLLTQKSLIVSLAPISIRGFRNWAMIQTDCTSTSKGLIFNSSFPRTM